MNTQETYTFNVWADNKTRLNLSWGGVQSRFDMVQSCKRPTHNVRSETNVILCCGRLHIPTCFLGWVFLIEQTNFVSFLNPFIPALFWSYTIPVGQSGPRIIRFFNLTLSSHPHPFFQWCFGGPQLIPFPGWVFRLVYHFSAGRWEFSIWTELRPFCQGKTDS